MINDNRLEKPAYPNVSKSILRSLTTSQFAKLSVFSEKGLLEARSLLAKAVSSRLRRAMSFEDLVTNNLSDEECDLLRRKKELRILDMQHASEFLRLADIRDLMGRFTDFDLAEVTYGHLKHEKRPEIYLRLVRPNAPNDVGEFHQDHWYNVLYTPSKAGLSSFKVWIAIDVPVNAGLKFGLGPRAAVDFDIVDTPEGPRPKLKVDSLQTLKVIQPSIKNGEAFIFSQFALHAGSINRGPANRVSVELAFFAKS